MSRDIEESALQWVKKSWLVIFRGCLLKSEREGGREATHSQGDQEMLERAIWTEQREGASLEIIGRRGDAVNETGPIGTRSKEETDRRADKKRVVWAAQRRQTACCNLQAEDDGARA